MKKVVLYQRCWFFNPSIGKVKLQTILQIICLFSFFLCLPDRLYAQNVPPAFNYNNVKHNAFHWIIIESNKDPQNLVNYLILPLFALKLSVDFEEKVAIKSLLVKRINELSSSSQTVLPVSQKYFFDYVVSAYVLFELDCQNNKYQKVSRTLLKKYSFEKLFPTDNSHFFSVEHTTKLMLLFMLERMEILPIGNVFQFIQDYRKKYYLVLKEESEYQLEQLLYFITHVIFIKSRLGINTVLYKSVIHERKILLDHVMDDIILKNNDLWPEIYLALSLIEGCPSKPYIPQFIIIMQNQNACGSWKPSTLKDTSMFHTTSLIYLALLGHQRCELKR
ncbi:MAG: hypothetical protein K8R74_13655 [Bacteroidales bacterium]|nr:hypothetical protein [Bacteroidales bacterium]